VNARHLGVTQQTHHKWWGTESPAPPQALDFARADGGGALCHRTHRMRWGTGGIEGGGWIPAFAGMTNQ